MYVYIVETNKIKKKQLTHYSNNSKRKKIWYIPVTKEPIPTENQKKQSDNTKTPPKTYMTIADRLRTISCSSDSHPTGVVEKSIVLCST